MDAEELWQIRLQKIARTLEQRQRPRSLRMISQRRSWLSTLQGSLSLPRRAGSWAGGDRSSIDSPGSLERLALRLDKLSLGLQAGTRLIWRPWHRAKHRLIAWPLCHVTPALCNALP